MTSADPSADAAATRSLLIDWDNGANLETEPGDVERELAGRMVSYRLVVLPLAYGTSPGYTDVHCQIGGYQQSSPEDSQ